MKRYTLFNVVGLLGRYALQQKWRRQDRNAPAAIYPDPYFEDVWLTFEQYEKRMEAIRIVMQPGDFDTLQAQIKKRPVPSAGYTKR